MPEGDTVFAAARRMNAALAGQTLTRSDFRWPAYATVDLSGRAIVEVVARGKHLLTRFDHGVTLHTHLKMEGEWQVARRGARWRGPGHEVRVVLETSDWQAIGFRLGIVELVDTSAEGRVVGHLGPDLLAPSPGESDDAAHVWDPREASVRLAKDPDRTIGEALLDQTVMAGIGNVYRSELCFLRGVHPSERVADAGDLERFVHLARKLLMANRRSARHVTTGDTRPGYERWVYGRKSEPCRRCGTPIARGELAGRVVYWCPHCQAKRAAGRAALDGVGDV